MTDETKENIGFVAMLIAVAIFTAYISCSISDWSWRRQIAGHHAAEFYIDKNNYRQWRWIDCQPSPVSVPNDSNTVKTSHEH